jgi:putative hydrolases of HD superfamily
VKISDIQKLRRIYKLKEVYRLNSVGNRKESSAEHTWSCLVLAEFFLEQHPKLNKSKVFELLLFHDFVEIEAGDTQLAPGIVREEKTLKEKNAAMSLSKKLPKEFGVKYLKLFEEFEEQKTPEAKFAKAIDAFDAELHEMDYKKDWKGWTEEFLRKSKEKYFVDFPILKKAFEETTEYAKNRGYFNQ